ncbi:hypothetical protein IFM51744_09096 [Aspergillus udagawae]|nr:hypothetical protein IFM51744_09096 [Aspergillus udagawae]
MSQLLTPRQAEELHKSILAYFSSINARGSSAAVREELDISDNFDDDTCRTPPALSVYSQGMRLIYVQILDLESQIADLKAELDSAEPRKRSKQNIDPTAWLPGLSSTRLLESHREAVTCIAFHPLFTSLASGSEDCTIKVWDWEFGELERTLKGHVRPVSGLDFGGQKGNTLLASCSSDLTIKLWDPNKDYANIQTLVGHDHSVSAVRFLTPTANRLVSASRDGTIRIWDVTTGFCVKVIDSEGVWIRDVSPSFDGKWLVAGGRDKAATIWEVASAESKVSLVGHKNYLECCAFAPPTSYKYLATLAGLKKPPPADSSSEFVATGARDMTIKLWDRRGRLIKTLVGHDNWVRGLVFHPGGRYLISVADDKTIRCWDLSQEGRLAKTIENAHAHFVSCIRWAPSIIGDHSTVESDTAVGRVGQDSNKPGFRCVIATGSADQTVRVYT